MGLAAKRRGGLQGAASASEEMLVPDTPTAIGNAAQIDYWNATAGEIWATYQTLLDRQIEPLGEEAMRVLAPRIGERIIDIGCGCGQSTIALAERVGESGAVVGADISRPMLDIARARPVPEGAAHPDFRESDVQSAELEEGAFDAGFSRFGVMFFADPVVAFRNIHMALKPGGRLAFVCWRPFPENIWMRAPMEAAAPFLTPSPPPDPAAPGPFAFADAGRVRAILADAGFQDVAIEPFDARIGGGTVEETMELAFRVGPLGAALRENPDAVDKVAHAVHLALRSFDTPNGVLAPAAVWIVTARA